MANEQPKRLFRSSNAMLGQKRSLTIATVSCFLVMLVIFVNSRVLFSNLERVRKHQVSVLHTSSVLEELDYILTSMVDAETGERGFIITGQPEYLEPFRAARIAVMSHLERLKELIADNPEQITAVTSLEPIVFNLIRRFEDLIRVRREKGFDDVKSEVQSGVGKAHMDNIRVIISRMKTREQELLKSRTQQSDASAETVRESVWAVAIVNFVILIIAYMLVRRYVRKNAEEQEQLTRDMWLKEGLAKLNDSLRENQTVDGVSKATLQFLADYVGIKVGTMYAVEGSSLKLSGTYAHDDGDLSVRQVIKFGQGLVGEVAVSRKLEHLKRVPDNYLKISSTLGDIGSCEVVILPILNDEELEGVIEMGSLTPFTSEQFRLFDFIKERLGVSIDAAQSRAHLQLLLEETQTQTEELQAQQEELRSSNEELETQAAALKMTQDRLQMQQEELRQSNEELSLQTKILETQKASLGRKNDDLIKAQLEIERKAAELAQASQYKSEFLANMSHELRTPLNSMLILSTLLFENETKNLSEKQIGFAKTIYRSGNDLLSLINDILDLAKVEAGKLNLNIEPIDLKTVVSTLDQTFRYLAEEKGLTFQTEVADEIATVVKTDRQRLEQVLKNFLSNALKFTDRGALTLQLIKPSPEILLAGDKKAALAFVVKDSGIGIPKEKQEIIFEAFQQADGSTSREYGGTGLGLTISRELSGLLGGRIEVESELGKGSSFTLYLPEDATVEVDISDHLKSLRGDVQLESVTEVSTPILAPREQPHGSRSHELKIFGDIEGTKPGDRLILIVDDDLDFGGILLDQAHTAGFKAIVAGDGESGFEVLEKYDIKGILLDLRLPDISGLSILERIKNDPRKRHIPIHIISGSDNTQNALKMGAVGYLIKPASKSQLQQAFGKLEATLEKSIKRVLVVEDDKVQREAICQLLRGQDIEIDAVGRGSEAEVKLAESVYDCMILDLKLPDISGFDLLEVLDRKSDGSRPPVVIYTGKDLTKLELERLGKYSESIIIKGAKSPERLLDEVSLFLHRVETQLPSDAQALLRGLRASEKSFKGRKVLIVDDDMRNVFALANALEIKGFNVLVGKNGKDGVDKILADPTVDIVLMDIMMPVMDGYEAIKQIRLSQQFKKLPIIALTAKAMRGDQEKCIEAGANDYLPKPIDLERLLSLMRVWLPQKNEI